MILTGKKPSNQIKVYHYKRKNINPECNPHRNEIPEFKKIKIPCLHAKCHCSDIRSF